MNRANPHPYEVSTQVKQKVRQAPPLSQEEFLEIMAQHDLFLEHGGAGGSWQTFFINNLIFGVYQSPGNKKIPGKQAKLGFHKLQGLPLRGVSLPYADCAAILSEGQNWEGADLEGSLFIDSILQGSSFRGADLWGVDFSRSDLQNCDFREARLQKVDFQDCNLSGSDFRGAVLDANTQFKDAILDQVRMD